MDDDDEPSPYAGLAEKIRGGKSATQLDYENRPPQVTVMRVDQGQRISLSLSSVVDAVANSIAFDVIIDDLEVARLYRGDKLQLDVTEGEHTIWISSSYGWSKKLRFTATNGRKYLFHSYIAFSGVFLYEQ